METQQQFQAHQQCPSSHDVFDVSIPQRRSANYKPTLWKSNFLESLCSKYDRKEYTNKAEELIKNVKDMLEETEEFEATLELINGIKKLGLTCHFEMEVKKALDSIAATIYKNGKCSMTLEDLYLASLSFRLLRQQGFQVSQDIFQGFMDDKKTSLEDIESMVELLEASNLALEGENTLDEAREFTTQELRMFTANSNDILNHALERPSHWRVDWFDVKWQINSTHLNGNVKIKPLLALAKLNFNMVQATLQKELVELSRWWKNIGLTEKLEFARDRLVESFMCAVGLAFQPHYKCLRTCLTKVVNFILIIDDVYDLYGSLEELKQFTIAVERWDFREIDQLPDCMKICFQTLYETTCEIANDIEKEIGFELVLPHLKKVWADFCKSLLVEAEWYHKGYIPSFEEYLSNAWISSSGPLLLVHSFFCIKHEVTQDVTDFLEKNNDLVYHISLIIRLCNDIGTSAAEQERGDAPSSIVCYMKEMNVSEDLARSHIKGMIANAWKKINMKCFATSTNTSSWPFINIALNAARVAHSLYQSGDAFGVQVTDNKKQILSLLVEPFA